MQQAASQTYSAVESFLLAQDLEGSVSCGHMSAPINGNPSSDLADKNLTLQRGFLPH